LLAVVEVIKQAEQGMSEPFYCKASDDNYYWVKGRNCTRNGQLYEFACAHLAKSMGLPIADFCLLEIYEDLHDEFDAPFKKLGYGSVFASKHVLGSCWIFGEGAVADIPSELRAQILYFDFWIKNLDRSNENPNLLIEASTGELKVIDHNLAFDEEFSVEKFFQLHLFSDQKHMFDDLDFRCQMEQKSEEAIQYLKKELANVPADWKFSDLEQTVDSKLDYAAIISTLERFQQSNFWRVV